MSKRWTIVAATAIVLLFSCTAIMASTNTMGIAEKQTIDFTAPTIIAGTVLPAGHYSVTHQMEGQTHVMIFKQLNGKAEARTNCNLVPLKSKAEHTSQRYLTNAQNQRVLEEITFEGDKATHILAQ